MSLASLAVLEFLVQVADSVDALFAVFFHVELKLNLHLNEVLSFKSKVVLHRWLLVDVTYQIRFKSFLIVVSKQRYSEVKCYYLG